VEECARARKQNEEEKKEMNFKNLKNDKERIAFLEDYRNENNGWCLWKQKN
jgi:hypothetical protein